MKRITSLIILLWLPSVLLTWSSDASYFYWRHQLTMLTGAIGFAYMAVAMLLAMRIPRVEEYVHGLDKGYALHKQMGIGALITMIMHWVLIESPKWLISLGLMEGQQRRQRLGGLVEGINWTHWAKAVGEYTFYIFIAFVAISLIQAISYRKFRFTHKIAGAIFLAGSFHGLLLLDYQWSSVGMNLAIWAAAIVGSICALVSLTGLIGRARIVNGEVTDIERVHDDVSQSRVLHVKMKLDGSMKYSAGQFAYVNFHDGEAPHPFSVLSYDTHNQELEFAIKDLGDYTHELYDNLSVGRKVAVEGGYGRFHIPKASNQVWIGAGIGIVPFIAWLNQLVRMPHSTSRRIELFYCRDNDDQTYFVKMLEKLVNKLPFVNLHIYTASHNEFLCADRVAQTVDLSDASVSFCGPINFGNILKGKLLTLGLNKQNFHSERFVMR
ncbi:ferredoxin reductase family protein [Vibrio ziniensis]|uniref:Iron reductase n=1 Tax=Vibrio ziniensis TaxID=2711221 RepID=A0A6G7CHL0_9VIBR|nr:ferric reductase-like transmembrane domain-containing protein [Vibrio ziniensis]QIH41564.1 iron reductase [Vibrio ziniensis]